MRFGSIKERVFKSKKDAMKALKWYHDRCYTATYYLDKANEWTEHKKDQHTVNIFNKNGWGE